MIMLRRSLLSAATLGFCLFSGAGLAQKAEFGTAAEARAMLDRAVVSMKADPAKTLVEINKGESGFRDRDLYVFCTGPDGKVVAHPDPSRIGLLQKDNKDVNGKPYGAEFAKVAEEGKIGEVDYMFPRPGADKTPVQKVSLVTRVSGHLCGVGYYK
jgi:hypothetical protein